MLQVPAFPRVRPSGNAVGTVLLMVLQVIAWLFIAAVIIAVLVVVVAVSAFVPIMRGGGPMGARHPSRRW